ncbi:hypothetical protein CHT98_04485 [Azospirillum brasilense]|uniref:Uncharacterized protein n=1 Tax=Azospirillum brasilense TaxID=192 RepID=A0A235HI12_AZOBR|nr:hypothetical protein CHT98_04485 [Azospirillum brasilense]
MPSLFQGFGIVLILAGDPVDRITGAKHVLMNDALPSVITSTIGHVDIAVTMDYMIDQSGAKCGDIGSGASMLSAVEMIRFR